MDLDGREPEGDEIIGEDRILTIPNTVPAAARLAFLPVFVWVLFGLDDRHLAGWILAGIGSTDWVDGYLARRLQQVSTVGKILDPVADRLLFFVGVGSIIIDGSAPLWFCIAVLVREVLVAAVTLLLAALGARRVNVTRVGKAATFFLMPSFPFFLIANADVNWSGVAEGLAWGFGLPGLVLSYYAAATYVPIARKALRDGRAVAPVE